MHERTLQAEHIKEAIRAPDFLLAQDNGSKKVRKKLSNGRTIIVVYYKEDFRGANDHLIITAYYNRDNV